MTKSEKIEIQNMINDAVQAGIVESIKFIFSDKNKLMEIIEDIALIKAMQECDRDEIATKEELFEILDSI